MTTHVTHMNQQGRIVVPARMRRELGLDLGAEVVMRVQDGALVVESVERAVAAIQNTVGEYLAPSAPSLVDELLDERRLEATGG